MTIDQKLPEFETERLFLREVKQEHIPSYQNYFSDYEIIRHLSEYVPWPFPDDGVESFLKSSIFPEQGKSQWLWGIFEKTNPEVLIGCVHLWREGKPENRGFWLGKPFWGKGYMTEAVSPVMDYAFNKLEFDQLVFANALGNERSRRIKEKTGARLLRIEPAKFVDQGLSEQEVWELKKVEWFRFKQDSGFK